MKHSSLTNLTNCSIIILLLIMTTSLTFAQNSENKRPMSVEDIWNMKRIGASVLSPDGKTLAFAVTTYSMDDNKGNTDIYLVNTDGTDMRAFRNTAKNESEPVFSPDGKTLYYTLDGKIRAASLQSKAKKVNDKVVVDLYTGASGMVMGNDGSMLFVSSVYPECTTQDCNKKKDQEKSNTKVNASIFTELMYRHWDDWRGEKRSHLFLSSNVKPSTENLKLIDLLPGSRSDVPPLALGSEYDYTFSPDSTEIAFTMNEDPVLATSTNNDIFIINIKDVNANGKTPYKKISVSKGNDFQPVYSPDGRYIAYLSMERAGFEADKHRIMLYDRTTGETRDLTAKFDRSAGRILWAPDSKSIWFNAQNEVTNAIYNLDLATGMVKLLRAVQYNSLVAVSPDGGKVYFKSQQSTQPHELFVMDANGGNVKQLTYLNKDVLAKIDMNPIEPFWFEGAGSKNVQAIMVKPPQFDRNKKYPMIFLIHGGPQGAFSDEFHYRWNLQMFAAKGYVVVAVNPRGSTGYGQQFTDEISGDWAGKVYVDLMNCYDHAILNYPFIDKSNVFAAGASYGGYMINWIEGHNDDGRFKALVCHDGVFNLESMYGSTEELWFPEWEYRGTPWQNRELYHKLSPHMYVDNFKTPMLVIHGGKDFRVPESQAFELFTSLQRKGVESKFLYFPEESHFVTRPQNSRLWWNTIFDWFEQHRK